MDVRTSISFAYSSGFLSYKWSDMPDRTSDAGSSGGSMRTTGAVLPASESGAYRTSNVTLWVTGSPVAVKLKTQVPVVSPLVLRL